MKKYIIYICFAFLFSNDFLPQNNSAKNYTQIFFKWPQIEDIEIYQLKIIEEYSEETRIYNISTNSIIVEDFLSWGNQYSWQVCGMPQNECHSMQYFEINNLPSYYPNQVSLLVSNNNDNNVTVLDFDSFNFSAAVDENGLPVWFVDKTLFPGTLNQKIIVTDYLNTGNFIGYGFGKGFEFDIDGNIVFQTPEDYGVHHHIIKENNSYFFIDSVRELHPCPSPCPDNLPDSIYWKADQFIQMDSNGILLKEWNLFDYIGLDEYNPLYLDRLSESYPDEINMDWTHSNSVYYDGENIFISIRNLSRIAKLSYNDSLIWHLGNIDFMNQIYFENNLEFSQQHSVQVLNNNNIIFFDNHSLLEPELSRCIEFSYDENDNSINEEWVYILPENMFTGSRGECDRLENGNTLITAGRSGNMLEVSNDQVIWHLEAKHNNNSVTMFRGKRIPHLYPLAYSFIINNLKGSYNNYFIDYNPLISFTLYNKGWSEQDFNYYIQNELGDTLYSSSMFAQSDSIVEENIDFELLNFVDQESYILVINASYGNEQRLEFKYNGFFGDINNDQIIDVIDIILLINFILESNDDLTADLNDDGILNVLDIVILINLILYE